jgi:hypothetical protein
MHEELFGITFLWLFRPFAFLAPKDLNYLAFQSFAIEYT